MPGTDGYDLMRRVRAGRYRQPRAIAVTAFARPEDRDRAIAAGFDAHVAKPVNAMRLIQLVGQLAIAARVDDSR
jgi:CheY-like chemotaxis protein